MKKNFDLELWDLDGKPIEREGQRLTVGSIAVDALIGKAEEDASGEAKAHRYKLALAIHGGGEHDLKAEDIALLKRLIGLTYLPLVVGRMYDFLDA